MKQLDALLNPKSVAVIGASADVNKTSGRPVSYLLKHCLLYTSPSPRD